MHPVLVSRCACSDTHCWTVVGPFHQLCPSSSCSSLQRSDSPGSDICPPGKPWPHWRKGQLLQTLAAVQHSGQHAALPASVSALRVILKVSLFAIDFSIRKRPFFFFQMSCLVSKYWIPAFMKLLLISGTTSWSVTKTSSLSSTTSVTTWLRRPCGSCRWKLSPEILPGARRTAKRRPRAFQPPTLTSNCASWH